MKCVQESNIEQEDAFLFLTLLCTTYVDMPSYTSQPQLDA